MVIFDFQLRFGAHYSNNNKYIYYYYYSGTFLGNTKSILTNDQMTKMTAPQKNSKNVDEKFVHRNGNVVPLQRQRKGEENAGIKSKNCYY